MFDSKKTTLYPQRSASAQTTAKSTMKTTNPFLRGGLHQSAKTTALGNGAVKLTTTGSNFVDQFGKVSNYKQPRSYADICVDMSTLWAQDKNLALRFTYYLRMITRTIQLEDGSKTSTTQRGQGLKHEGIYRMIWLAINAPDTFWKNVSLFISVGSWKDIIQMLSFDLQHHGWTGRVLDWNKFGQLILAGLENPSTCELVKKFLPQIKAGSACHTVEAEADSAIAKWVCSLLYGVKEDETGTTYKKYRKLKSSGTAHSWQQLISQGNFLAIDFNSVHGRALSQMVSGKFLKNHELEAKYEEFIAAKPVLKFTGYPYELFAPLGDLARTNVPSARYQVDTINKQFMQLVEVGKKGLKPGENGFIGVIDTSGSMQSKAIGAKASAYVCAKSMALYFSYLLEGKFSKAYLEFSGETVLKVWEGNTPLEQYANANRSFNGNTNFLSVAKHFGDILKEGVAESEFPTGILCMTDGCFDPTYVYNCGVRQEGNFKALLLALRQQGFSDQFVDNFRVVLWDIPNGHYGASQTAFEEFADCPNLFHLSGFDGAVLGFLTGVEHQASIPKTSDELFLAAMDQEVLNLLEV